MGRVAVVCVLFGLFPAGAAAAPRSGVSGHVGTGGACTVPSSFCDRERIPATIRIERVRTGELVRSVHTRSGRFRVHLRPGRYRIRAAADSGNEAGSVRVRVRRHRFTSVVVRVHPPAM